VERSKMLREIHPNEFCRLVNCQSGHSVLSHIIQSTATSESVRRWLIDSLISLLKLPNRVGSEEEEAEAEDGNSQEDSIDPLFEFALSKWSSQVLEAILSNIHEIKLLASYS
jgi:hypothetical protein